MKDHKPIECVGAVIVRNKRILLVKRALYKESYAGCWCAPGGGIEKGESPEDAIIREVKEELGCEFSIKECLGQFLIKEEGFTLNAHRFLGDIRGEIDLGKEATAYKWVDYEGAGELEIGFQYEKMIDLLYKREIIR